MSQGGKEAMGMPMLTERLSDFPERDLFLQLALGMVSFARRFDEVLAIGLMPAPDEVDPDPDDVPREEALTFFLLGLVAFRERAMALVDQAVEPGVDANPSAATRAPVTPLRDLLR